MHRIIAALALLLAAFAVPAPAQDEVPPKKLLASSKVKDRLWGIFVLTRDRAEPKAEELLIAALGDHEWEVVEAAATALAKLGSERAVPALVDVVVRGPARRMRLAAAAAIHALSPARGAEEMALKLKGEDVAELADALAIIGGDGAIAVLEKHADSKKPELMRAARLAICEIGGVAQFDRLAAMVAESDLELRVAGMRGLARTGDARGYELLLARLSTQKLSDVEERRVRRALVDLARARVAAGAEAATAFLERHLSGSVSERHARLLADVAADEGLKDARAAAVARLAGCAGAGEAGLRSAAIHALGRLGAGEHAALIEERALKDGDERVRFHALRALVALRGAEAGAALATAIAKDTAGFVREEAAALAGQHAVTATATALEGALADPSWPVANAAAISLGKLRHAPARPALVKLLASGDWRLRAAAALALAWLREQAAVDALVEAAADSDDTVRATIQHALRRITGQHAITKPGEWKTWWKKNRETAKFVDSRAARKADADRYDAATAYSFYDDLDVVTVKSPRPGGDHIEQLLARCTIKHRLVEVGGLEDCGLHPFAIAVVNCSGEVLPEDVERIEWFVRSGGYLFASCWGLTETIGKAFPGVAELHRTPAQVMDEVRAEPLGDDGMMRSVIRPGTRTRYVLEGSHLISVEDDERFEVLVDSVQCAARWGEGNLAGFFTVGHGLVFDSANHFDLQGMKRTVPEGSKERKVLAMDVLGYAFDEIRELEDKGVFKSEKRCAEQLEDLSMFRLLTNFVMKKRRAEL